jgi:hypothetical protein
VTMLPDVSQEGYDEWQQQLYTEDTDRKIQGLGFTHQANDRIADLSRIGVWAEASTPEGPPPPAPVAVEAPPTAPLQAAPVAVEVPPEAPPEPVASAAPAAAPATPPVRGAALSPTSSAPEPSPDWENQVFGQALGAVSRAGGDVQAFADRFGSGLSGAKDVQSVFGHALGAASAAGADVQAFADAFQPPERPAPARQTLPYITKNGDIPSLDELRQRAAVPVAGGPLQDYARQAALKAGVDPDIFVRQIQQESGFNPGARSPAGAQGIAQIVPKFHPGVDVTDPYASLDYAANLMKSNVGKYGGDYAKALAAYNAGGGAVDKYGGVPPFEETQRYVSTILSGTSPSRTPTPAEGLSRAGGALGQANRDISQFGDPQLTNDEAYSACGPAAAVRFAQRFGRNPSLREATDLARSVGWTSAQGMAGLGSEKALMDKLGVATKLVSGADWGTFANEARTGNPVTISTQGHYFTADGWDPNTNRFHVGRSGLDLKGGSEWMTPEQMTAIMGPVQGGLLADNPQVPAPSVADQDTNPAGWLDRTRKSMADSLSGAGNVLQQGIIEPLRGALSLESTPEPHDADTARLDASVMQAASVPGGARPLSATTPEVAGAQARNPLEALGDTIGGGLRNLGIGGEAAQPVNAPGGGYDPSALRAVETPSEPGLPLRQDVRDIAQEPQPTVFQDPTLIPRVLRGPLLTSDQEVLDEAAKRGGLEEARNMVRLTTRGREPTDTEVASMLRSMSLGEAYAGTHTGEGAAADLGRVPVTGEGILQQAMSRLDQYPETISAPLREAVEGLRGQAAASDIARTVQKWIEQNPPGQALTGAESQQVEALVQARAPRAAEMGLSESDLRDRITQDVIRARPMSETVPSEQIPMFGGPEVQPRMEAPRTGDFEVPTTTPRTAEEVEAARQQLMRSHLEGTGGYPGGPATGVSPGRLADQDIPRAEFGPAPRQAELGLEVPGELNAPGRGSFETPTTATRSTDEVERARQQLMKAWLEDTGGATSHPGGPATGAGPRTEGGPSPGPVGEAPPISERLPKWAADSVRRIVDRSWGEFDAATQGARTGRVDPKVLEDLATAAKTSPDRVQRVLKLDDPANAETAYAMRQAMENQGAVVQRAQQALRDAPDSLDAQRDLLRELAGQRALQETAAGKPPKAGRQLEQFRYTEVLDDMANRFGRMKPEEFMRRVREDADFSDPASLADFVDKAYSYTFKDKAMAVWYFSLLSNPLTHIRNTVGNTIAGLTAPVETGGAALFDPLARKMLGDTGPRQRYAQEVLPEYAGWISSLPDGVKQGWRRMVDGMNDRATTSELSGSMRAGGPLEEAFGGGWKNPINVPGRALAASDDLFRSANENAALHGLAQRTARIEGHTGEALTNRIAELIKRPTTNMLEEAAKTGEYRVFQQELSGWAKKINDVRTDSVLGRFLVPFMKTPINLMEYVLERSPAGLAGIGRDFATTKGRAGLQERGAGDLADRMSRAAIGTITWGYLAKQAFDGNLTGRMPSDPTERDAWRREGKQSYSFRSPVDGKWTSYLPLSPYSTIFASAASVADAHRKGEIENPDDIGKIGLQMGLAFAEGMVDTQWTQQFADALDIVNGGARDPGDALTKFATRQATNINPGILRGIARATDSTLRDPQNPIEGLLSGNPFTQDRVPAELNAWGEPIQRPTSGIEAMINPFNPSAETTDPVEHELRRLQTIGDIGNIAELRAEPSLVGKDVSFMGVQPVEMTDEQQRKYQQLSGYLSKTLLDILIPSDQYQQAPDREKAKMIKDIYEKTRSSVREGMQPELLDRAIAARVRAAEAEARLGATPVPPAATPTREPAAPGASPTPRPGGPVRTGGGAVGTSGGPVRTSGSPVPRP